MVGSDASMRLASVTAPSFSGTLRSARMKTRFPATSTSSMYFSAMTRRPYSAEAAAEEQGDVAHAAREAPLVVVPRQHLHEVAVDDARELGIEDRGIRAAVEIRGDERLLAVLKDALQGTVGGLFHGGVDLLRARLRFELGGEVDERDVRGRDADGHAVELAFEVGQHERHCLRGAGR